MRLLQITKLSMVSQSATSTLSLPTNSYLVPKNTIESTQSTERDNLAQRCETYAFYVCRRRPAWTDRIIYRIFENNYEHQNPQQTEGDQVKCKTYKSHANFTVSDHKPVSAQFDIKVRFLFLFPIKTP